MSTATTTQPTSAATFLFGEGDEGISALAASLREEGALGSVGSALTKLSGAGLRAVGDQIATIAHGLLDLDLGELLTQGWQRFDDLVGAARRTVAAPGSREVVDLVDHTVSSSHSPHVDVLLDGVTVVSLGFVLDLDFVVKGAVATVHDGRLAALHTGECVVTGTVAAEGHPLVTREREFQLPLLLELGDGIPLLGGRPDPGRMPVVSPSVSEEAQPSAG